MLTWKVIGRDFENKPTAILVKAHTLQAAKYKAGRGQVPVPRIDSIALHQTQEQRDLEAAMRTHAFKAFRAMQTFPTPQAT